MKDFSNAAFAPDQIEAMRQALERAVATLPDPVSCEARADDCRKHSAHRQSGRARRQEAAGDGLGRNAASMRRGCLRRAVRTQVFDGWLFAPPQQVANGFFDAVERRPVSSNASIPNFSIASLRPSRFQPRDRKADAERAAGIDRVAQDLGGGKVDLDDAGCLQHDQAQLRGRGLHQRRSRRAGNDRH